MISNGIDLVDINRFEKLKIDKNFMNKIFSNNEIAYINKSFGASSTIAGMFAAKEAFLKANKKGINNYSLKDIEISHDDNNAPSIILHNDLKNIKYKSISLSISHEKEYAIAIVSLLF